VLATFGGWLLGIVAVILLAEISGLIHLGDQFAVGIGMGSGVGFVQWRVARKWFGASSGWMWASVVALGTPFVLTDVMAISWAVNEEVSLFINAFLGALLLGLLQWRILRARSERAHWWIGTCIAAWMLPAAGMPLIVSGHPESLTEITFNIVVILFGGLLLGVVTGTMLVWTLRSRLSAS